MDARRRDELDPTPTAITAITAYIEGARMPPRVLVIDVGGHNIKVGAPDAEEPKKIPSGPHMGPAEMVEAVHRGWAGPMT